MRTPPGDHPHDRALPLDSQPVPSGTLRTITLTMVGMDCPLAIQILADVSWPADQVMHVLWAAAGVSPSSSALLSRQNQRDELEFFGLTAAWENSANRDVVRGLGGLQFAQLFTADTELYAELDPGRGYRARVKLAAEGALSEAAEGTLGSSVRIAQEPFGIPEFLTAAEVDVLLQASDGERLTPVQQQMLVDLADPVELPIGEVCQAMALATHHGVRLGLPAELITLIPWIMVEFTYVLAARELLRFIYTAPDGVAVTADRKLTAATLQELLNDPAVFAEIFEIGPGFAGAPVDYAKAPLVHTALEVLGESGLVELRDNRAVLATELSWLNHATAEEFDSYFEVVMLRWLLDRGELTAEELPLPELHPTLAYETAQDYADSLISSALSLPAAELPRVTDDPGFHGADLDATRDHVEFTIELMHLSQPVTRRMSVPLGANLHASIETILVMFGWQLTHLWQLSQVKDNGMHEPLATSFLTSDHDIPLAADLVVQQVLRADGPQLVVSYDFGDGWQMLITPLGIRRAGSGGELLAAHGACPPEDSGGPGQYEMNLLALRDPAEFQRQYPEYESTEIQEIANWARAHDADQHVPTPDVYALDDHALPYEL